MCGVHLSERGKRYCDAETAGWRKQIRRNEGRRDKVTEWYVLVWNKEANLSPLRVLPVTLQRTNCRGHCDGGV